MGIGDRPPIDVTLQRLCGLLSSIEACGTGGGVQKQRLLFLFKEAMATLMVHAPHEVLDCLRALDTSESNRQMLLGNYVDRCVLLEIGMSDALLVDVIALSQSWLTLDLLLRHFVTDEFSRKRVEKRKLELIRHGRV